MPNATVIIIGSGYNEDQEQRMKFVHELIDNGYKVNVKSIDIVPPQESKDEMEHLTVDRISMNVEDSNQVNNFVESLGFNNQFGNEQNVVIIMDSISYEGIHYGNIVKSAIEEKFPASHVSEIIHFISPRCDYPTFNGDKLISQFDFQGFSLQDAFSTLDANRDIDGISDMISKNPEKFKKAISIMDQSIRSGNTTLLEAFLYNTLASFPIGLKNLIKSEHFEKCFDCTRNYTTQFVCKQISMEKIGLDLLSLRTPDVEPMIDDPPSPHQHFRLFDPSLPNRASNDEQFTDNSKKSNGGPP